MKKYILLSILLLVGCAEKNPDGSYSIIESKDALLFRPCLFVVDSCEYLLIHDGAAHKGNCKFCEERRKRELNKIVEQIKNN